MQKYKNIDISDTYGRWTVIEYAGKKGHKVKKDHWLCECSCENHTKREVLGETLKNGRSKSCGCLQKESAKIVAEKLRTIFLNPGDKFGHWTVKSFSGSSPYKGSTNTYECECDCEWHTRKIIQASHLVSGATKSCKKCSNIRRIDGKRFGRLVALNIDVETSDNIDGRIYYKCQCDCGNIVSVRSDSLVDGNRISCGCIRHEYDDLSGMKYGTLTVLSYYDTIDVSNGYTAHRRRWKCRCDCGSEIVVREGNLLSGNTCSCGCDRISAAEKKAMKLFEHWGVTFKSQYRFDDCKDRLCLPFDFYIPSHNVCIEIDGEDHFMPINRGGWNDTELNLIFKDRQKKDTIKTKYCVDNNIPLIRIPYWDFDDLEYILFDALVQYGVIEEISTPDNTNLRLNELIA